MRCSVSIFLSIETFEKCKNRTIFFSLSGLKSKLTFVENILISQKNASDIVLQREGHNHNESCRKYSRRTDGRMQAIFQINFEIFQNKNETADHNVQIHH